MGSGYGLSFRINFHRQDLHHPPMIRQTPLRLKLQYLLCRTELLEAEPKVRFKTLE
jgi:hypothetical protein